MITQALIAVLRRGFACEARGRLVHSGSSEMCPVISRVPQAALLQGLVAYQQLYQNIMWNSEVQRSLHHG